MFYIGSNEFRLLSKQLRGLKDFLDTFDVIFESFIDFEKIKICDASKGILEFLLI